MDWLRTVKDDLLKAAIVKIRQEDRVYEYIVNPLSSGVPEIPSEALWGCGYEVARILDLKGAEKIMSPEAMGFHIAAALSMVTGLPLLMIRKRPYFLPGEVKVVKRTGYEESAMYINGVRKGDRVVLVDSLIATGGTLIPIIKALSDLGVVVQDAAAVIERKGMGGVQAVERETGVRVKTLLKVDLVDGKVRLEA
jgi:adenine phosphoribosyltransferase